MSSNNYRAIKKDGKLKKNTVEIWSMEPVHVGKSKYLHEHNHTCSKPITQMEKMLTGFH